mmetsp:Transcript_6060/g.9469  ORF Transcript_6060/g.9469 Transcript_6060/m.9469 type:complete len:132 (-) Transcript_6060:1234-1629(-)
MGADGWVDFVLKWTAAFEFVQAGRILFTKTSMKEFNPFLSDKEQTAQDPKYRRLYAVFVLMLGLSRYSLFFSKNKAVMRITVLIHALELKFFYDEFKAIKKPTDQHKLTLGALGALPAFLFLSMAVYPKRN